MLKMKEKDQEIRLRDLKVKELKRNIRHTQLKPLDLELTPDLMARKGRGQRGLRKGRHMESTPNIHHKQALLTEENVRLHEQGLLNTIDSNTFITAGSEPEFTSPTNPSNRYQEKDRKQAFKNAESSSNTNGIKTHRSSVLSSSLVKGVKQSSNAFDYRIKSEKS